MTAVAENTDTAIAITDKEADGRRKLAILKAVGLDRAAPEQRELAIAIAKRYDLDLMLKHLVLIEGKPYVTRDALLWIAHRDGNLDGIEVTEPVVRDYQGTDYWYCEATVYRKDMTHPFKYGGRYPTKGGNQKFAPEMATKVAESMALRRAFNISAPTQDERWDAEIPNIEPEAPKSLSEKVAERASAVVGEPVVALAEEVFDGEIVESATEGASPLEQALAAMPAEAPETSPEPQAARMVQCESKSPYAEADETAEQCRKEQGHKGPHRTGSESWQ